MLSLSLSLSLFLSLSLSLFLPAMEALLSVTWRRVRERMRAEKELKNGKVVFSEFSASALLVC